MYSLPRNTFVLICVLLLAASPAVAQVPAPPPVGDGVKVVKGGETEPEKKDAKSEPTPAPKEKNLPPADQDEPGAPPPVADTEPLQVISPPEPAPVKPAPAVTKATVPATKATVGEGLAPSRKGDDSAKLEKPEPASTPAVQLPTSPPQRKLEISPAVRAKISGLPPEDEATDDAEMKQMSAFEHQAFPRPGAKIVLPGDVSGAEGQAPATRSARPGASNPPEGLRSQGRLPGSAGGKATPPPPPPLPGWISKLTMPDIPVRWTPSLIKYLEFYRSSSRGRAILRRWLARMGRYRKLMEGEILRQKLPKSLLFLAMVESGYDPRRTSYAGAGGLWQFMPFSGRGYGLRRDFWIDERRNPRLSTEAALKYLKDLYVRFGSWELAMASYNAGYGAVQKAVQKYNTNDYWTLCTYEAGLPWSTCLYVPKILALAVVDANRAFFGYQEIKEEEELTFELVAVADSITLAQAARAAGVKTEVLDLLNPELRRDRTPPGVKSWMRVPRGTGEAFYAGLARLKGETARYRPHLARLGETVSSIARTHGISRLKLRQINGFTSDSELTPGLTILVPAKAVNARKKSKKSKKSKAKPESKSKSKSGDEDEGEEADEEEAILVPIPRDAPSVVPNRRRIFYRVVPGDHLKLVAKYLEVTPDQLAGWNSLDLSAKLVPGMVLQAFAKEGFDGEKVLLLDPERVQVMASGSEEYLDLYEQRKGRKRQIYTARKGDTLRSVGRRMGLTIGDLARINKFTRHTNLKPGQKIIVYLDEAKAKPDRKKKRRGKKSRRGKKRRDRKKTS